MIELKNVSKKFGKKPILKNIDCEIDQGIYGLLGPNGAGKTTLMRCITNLYSLTGGEILVNDIPVKKNKKINVGYLPQSFGLFKELTVYDAMQYFCNLKDVPRARRKEEITRCLKAVNMEGNAKKACGKLSGGMMRRIGVAQALLNQPDVILFDEPTAGLDPEERMRFKNVISGFGTNEVVIISTHIVEDIEACCEKVIVMNNGQICCIKTCEELKELARKHVISCKKGEESKISGDFYIEKQYEEQGQIFYRVLVSGEQDEMEFPYMEPTIEDGYMMTIKGL
nr:ATP-binding cassette domain-containing protein [Eubacterium sp.]